MKAIIPIAGRGTRLLPATKETAKELLPILDIPAIHYVVQEAVKSGVEQIIFVSASHKRNVENFYDRNHELEEFLESRGQKRELELIREIGSMVDVVTVRQKQPLGLGHAILCAKNVLRKGESFAVLLGDEIIFGHEQPATGQLFQVFRDHDATAVVGVVEICPSESHQYGIVEAEQLSSDLYRLSGMVEKPLPDKCPSCLAVPGRYIFSYEIFKFLEQCSLDPKEGLQLTDAIHQMCQDSKSKVLGCLFSGERYDTGTLKGYFATTIELAIRDPRLKEYAIAFMKDKISKIRSEK